MVSGLKKFLDFIKIEHTVFDLPFAYAGVLLSGIITLKIIILVTIAGITARVSGFAMNRIIDLPLDRLNPRTKKRALVTGEITMRQAYIILLISSSIFIISAFMLNILAGILSPLILFLFYLYPKTKKIPVVSHIFLGISIALIVLAGYVASTAKIPYDINLYLIMIFVAFWIGGFDIIYQYQDYVFDKKMGIKSIPVLVNGKIVLPTFIFFTISLIPLYIFSLKSSIFLILTSIIAFLLYFRLLYVYKFDVDRLFKIFDSPVPFILITMVILYYFHIF